MPSILPSEVSAFGKLVSGALLAVLLTAATPTPSAVAPAPGALEPATTGGMEVVDRALAKLATHRRLLVIGAHPDDEDTSLLALVSRGLGGDAAYLALSRGEGGQNLIGDELGEALGVLRTQELLAARRVDGARQFFTRAYDFGYTRSLEETLERWPKQTLLEDAVRVVRRFRPQVVVAMFSSELGGHGQHLAAGWVAEQVLAAAGDGERFEGVGGEPWQPAALYRRTFFDPESATLQMSLAEIEPLSGRSVRQIAMASRSQHRSQDMGMLQPLGAPPAGFEWVAGGVGRDAQDLFAGVETDLTSLAAEVPPSLRSVAEATLARVEQTAIEARRTLSPVRLEASAPALAEIVTELRSLEQRLPQGPARDLVEEKISIAEVGLAAAAAVAIDATASRDAVAPGQSLDVSVSLWNAGSEEVSLRAVDLLGRSAWSFEPADPPTSEEDGVVSWNFAARLGEGAMPTMPYYLEAPRRGDLYDWSGVPEELRGEAERGPELVARLRLAVGGTEIELEREVVWRRRDQALGEVRRPIRIVPRAEIALETGLVPWRLGASAPRRVGVTITSHADEAIAGRVRAIAPDGWVATEPTFQIAEPGGKCDVEVEIRPEGGGTSGRSTLRLEAEVESVRYGLALPLVEYPHIHPRPVPVPAEITLSAFDLVLPAVTGEIGYVLGAADRVPAMLAEVGVPVAPLDGATLEHVDLSAYRVIVIGSRAYETDPELAGVNQRLLDWVAAGGTLIVQYQQYGFFDSGLAPYRLEIARPHDRITDETAPVRLLVPDHPAFRYPNRLGPADWDGWVQERGLYFAHDWDPAYTPLVAMRDPDQEERRGGLLVARLGEGVYVYTGIAFFRQLPAGVPGGYRLFANLLALD